MVVLSRSILMKKMVEDKLEMIKVDMITVVT